MKEIRVLMYIADYHPVFTGHGIYIRQLIRLITKNNLQISVLTWDHGKYPIHEAMDGISIYRIKSKSGQKRWEIKQTLRAISFLFRNRKLFDILHLHGHLDHYGIITLFCKLFRKKIIMQMVLMGSDDPLTIKSSYKYMWLRFKLLSQIDKFIYISKPIGQACIDSGLPSVKLLYIPQGVDLSKFSPISPSDKKLLRCELSLPVDAKIVVFVGAIIHRKGVDILVDAWKTVQAKCANALLLLIGSYIFGEEDESRVELNSFVEDLQKTIADHNLNVELVGRIDCVDSYLKASDVFVLPSRKEGFGNVILEAMACGIPPVITYMDGVSAETVNDNVTGIVAQDTQLIAQAIIKLISNEKLAIKMGSAARMHVEENFDLLKIANRYSTCYNEITCK